MLFKKSSRKLHAHVPPQPLCVFALDHVCLVGARLLEGVGILEVLGTGILLPVALLLLVVLLLAVEAVREDLPDTGVVVRFAPPAVGSGETAVLLLAAVRWCGELLTGVLVLVVPLALPFADMGVVLLAADLGGGVLWLTVLCLGLLFWTVASLVDVVVGLRWVPLVVTPCCSLLVVMADWVLVVKPDIPTLEPPRCSMARTSALVRPEAAIQ